MSSGPTERVEAEISLLEAMYPSQLTYNNHTREIHYDSGTSAQLVLRLPDTYPEEAAPEIITARDSTKNDVRNRVKQRIRGLQLPADEECLDRIIVAFEEYVAAVDASRSRDESGDVELGSTKSPSAPNKTVIIWLHHLLATSKRKLAIAPSIGTSSGGPQGTGITGITKPGYPGIMLFSGPAVLVDDHVRELRGLNWQAFQVRYDSSEDHDGDSAIWTFTHEKGIVEVETMAEVVKEIADEEKKKLFLQAVGVK